MQINYLLLAITFLVILIISALLWFLPKQQVKKLDKIPESKKEEKILELKESRLKLEDDYRKTLAQIVGGIIILIGLAVTFSTYLLNIEKQDLDREGQMTDRFSRAIAHLGDDDPTVRIGGLFELERVAKDSSKDKPTVKQVLLAYLHNKYSIKEEKLSTSLVERKENSNGLVLFEYTSQQEAQTIINILKKIRDKDEKFDLRHLDLSEKNLANLSFSRSNFSSSNLSGSVLFASNFSGAVFRGANLSKVTSDLNEHLETDDEGVAHLVFIDEVRVNFSGADFSDATISDSDFTGAILVDAKLRNSNLTKSIFYKADMTKANATFSTATYTNFKQTDLTRANFFGANLSQASFQNSILNLTNFSNADLRDAIGLTLESLEKAIISDKTLLPKPLEIYRQKLLAGSELNQRRKNTLINKVN